MLDPDGMGIFESWWERSRHLLPVLALAVLIVDDAYWEAALRAFS